MRVKICHIYHLWRPMRLGIRMDYTIGPDEDMSMGVVRAVSTRERCKPTSLPPLVESVDPDALNSLFAGPRDADAARPLTASFLYSSSQVTVHPDN